MQQHLFALLYFSLNTIISFDVFCFPIAVRASQWLEQRGGTVLDPHSSLVAAKHTWSQSLKLGGHVSVRPRMKPPNTLLLHCSSLLISFASLSL